MSKKHFEAAAEMIRGMYVAANQLGLDNEAGRQMQARAAGAEDVWVSVSVDANPRFDSVRFRQACRP